MNLEIETRYKIETPGGLSSYKLESKIMNSLGALLTEITPSATDFYYNPEESQKTNTWRRLRCHIVEGIKGIELRVAKQTKEMRNIPENKYGIELAIETEVQPVKSIENEIEGFNGNPLIVCGNRHSYSVGGLIVNFDRMILPRGDYIEIGVEVETDEQHLDFVLKKSVERIGEFLEEEFLKLLEELNVRYSIEPIYPKVLMRKESGG